jgi:hypothetical protein
MGFNSIPLAVFKNINFRIFSYYIEELPLDVKSSLEKKKYRVIIYSKIHRSADWSKEYSFESNKKIGISSFLELERLILNLKEFFEVMKKIDEPVMFSYKNVFYKFKEIDIAKKVISGKLIDSNLKNYLDLEKSENAKFDIIKYFHKIKLYNKNEIVILGNSIYLNGEHKIFTSKVKLEEYLKKENIKF